MGSELKPEVLAEMRKHALAWSPPERDRCIGEEHMARDVLELLDEIERLRAEAEELRSEAEQAVQAIERWMPLTDSLPVAVNKMVDEIKLLRRRCDMRDRSAAQWSEAAKREAPTPEVLERARERFVECKIRQEEAPPGSIMRRVCDAAMELADLLEQREKTMKARVVELALEVERLREELDRIRENNDCILSGSLANHLAAAEVKDALRDAFDAGARAMRASVWENYNKDGDFGFAMFATEDITKLPGRPE